jgi:hypothetical protein
MEWDRKSLLMLTDKFRERYYEMRKERPTDRRNFSVIWNRYLSSYGITLLQSPTKSKFRSDIPALLGRVMEVINYENDLVRDALIIGNPDRNSQYLLVPREAAQKILILGMI